MKAYLLGTPLEKRDIDRILENDDRLPFIDMRMKPGKISAAFLHHLVAKINGVLYIYTMRCENDARARYTWSKK